jgi:hypothetical protein
MINDNRPKPQQEKLPAQAICHNSKRTLGQHKEPQIKTTLDQQKELQQITTQRLELLFKRSNNTPATQ